MTTQRWTTVFATLALLASCRGDDSSGEGESSEAATQVSTESSAAESGESSAGDGDGDPGDGEPGDGEPGDGDPGTKFDMLAPDLGEPEPTNPLWASAHLWYSIDDKLIYIELDPADGSVANLVFSPIQAQQPLTQGQAGITMLLDDQDEIDILMTRVTGQSTSTSLYRIHAPPTDGSPVDAELLGVVPDDLLIEALYTDCEGRVYLMDTGADVSSAAGNRLIRLTGDYLAGANHVLPTGGAARYASPLGTYDFRKRTSLVEYDEAAARRHAADIAVLAEVEGLDAHGRSARMRDGGDA